MPETYPKVHNWESGGGFNVEYANGSYNQVDNAHVRALHAVLTEKIAEMDAKRWVVSAGAYSSTVQTAKDVGRDPAAIFWEGDHKADAEEYAARLNEREGLA